MSKSLNKPACVNCKHHEFSGGEHWCKLPVWDFVLGHLVSATRRCYDMRGNYPGNASECGKLAAKFEARE